jgi:hypothetical protein
MLSVPEGRTDRRQAVYCLECIQTATRPVGYGVIGYYRRLNLRGCAWVFHLEAIPAGAGKSREPALCAFYKPMHIPEVLNWTLVH